MARLDNFKKLLKKRIDIPMPFLKGKIGEWLKKDGKLTPKYFRDSYRELQKVTWPSRKETLKLFVAVIAFSFVLALLIAIVDQIFERLIERILL